MYGGKFNFKNKPKRQLYYYRTNIKKSEDLLNENVTNIIKM